MKRERNSGSYAAMLRFKSLKRFKRGGISDHYGNLPTFRDICRLALGWGFWISHCLYRSVQVSSRKNFFGRKNFSIVLNGIARHAVKNNIAVKIPNGSRCCWDSSLWPAHVVCAGGDSVGFVWRHGCLRGVRELYAVTSDVSTTIRRMTV